MQMMLLFLKQNRTKQKPKTITMQYYEMKDIPARVNGTRKKGKKNQINEKSI